MPFHIVRDDVTAVAADAVVVPANSKLVINGGVGLQVAARADAAALQAACAAAAPCPVGTAVAVDPCGYPARCLVFAAGPRWPGSAESQALQQLEGTVRAALDAAAARECGSIALPLISAGHFGFPAEHAFACGSAAVRAFLSCSGNEDVEVTLALFEREAVCAGNAHVGAIAELVDDAYVAQALERERRRERELGRERGSWRRERSADEREREWADAEERAPYAFLCKQAACSPVPMAAGEPAFEVEEDAACAPAPVPKGGSSAAPAASLEELLASLDAPFGTVLVRLIDVKGMTDPEVYRAANMKRQTFSKIRSNPAAQPKKGTVLALAVALRLTLPEAEAFLAAAGYAFAPSSPQDAVVKYFIERGMYNIFDINEMLYRFDLPLL